MLQLLQRTQFTRGGLLIVYILLKYLHSCKNESLMSGRFKRRTQHTKTKLK